ncbi:hypothetical protein ACFSB1_15785 [Halopseudomonas phragmitis]|nr:hypothetical protein [Halopseudomonas phragmitis]
MSTTIEKSWLPLVVVFTLPIEHIAGIAYQQIEAFEQLIKNEI